MSPSDHKEKKKLRERRPSRREIKEVPTYNVNDLSKPNGYLFTCNQYTMKECLEKQLFGSPASSMEYMHAFIVLLYYKYIQRPLFTKIFIYNYSAKKLFGVYEATTEPAMSIDNSAWTTTDLEDSPFPAQVQVTPSKLYKPIAFDLIKQYIPKISFYIFIEKN